MKDNQTTLSERKRIISGVILFALEMLLLLGRTLTVNDSRVLDFGMLFKILGDRWDIMFSILGRENILRIYDIFKIMEVEFQFYPSRLLETAFNIESLFTKSSVELTPNPKLNNVLPMVISERFMDAPYPPTTLFVLSHLRARFESISNDTLFREVASSFGFEDTSSELVLHFLGIPHLFTLPTRYSEYITSLHLKWTHYEVGPTWIAFTSFLKNLHKLETLTMADLIMKDIPTYSETINLSHLRRIFLSLDTKLCKYILDSIVTSEATEIYVQCLHYTIKDTIIIPPHISPASTCQSLYVGLQSNSIVLRATVQAHRKQELWVTLCLTGMRPGSQNFWFRNILNEWIKSSFLKNAQQLLLFIENDIAGILSRDLWTNLLSPLENLRKLTFANENLDNINMRRAQNSLMQSLDGEAGDLICPRLAHLSLKNTFLSKPLRDIFENTLQERINIGSPIHEVIFDVGVGASEKDLSSLSTFVPLSYGNLIEHDSVEDSILHDVEISELRLADSKNCLWD